MPSSARRICILLVILVAAVTAFLSAGPSPDTARDGDAERPEQPSEDLDSADLVVDLYLV